MEYRNLGRSGLKVSKMALGTNAFGTRTDEATAIRIVHAALDAGINLIDTADMYGQGESERMIGLALKDRRSRAVLATKCWYPTGDGPNDRGASRKHIMDAVDASLRRLQTDYIDLYQIHRWDGDTPIEETMRALEDLVRAGKVRYIGCSNFAAWQIVMANAVADRHGWSRFISNQPEYSPVSRQIEQEVIPACLADGVGQIVYFPLAGGLFTGKYRRGEAPPPDSRAAKQGPRFAERWLTPAHFDLVEAMEHVAREAGLTLTQLTLAWVMARPGVTAAIVGASRPEQVAENVSACEVQLPQEVMDRVTALSEPFTR
ncbi:aldo/keto reductase [Symbiobacterium thermophilum]|uniref:Oxidoreductase n=1 Tax=Symbiobacterium thermophilum (strain DSM 24528 / JCM 14929 / IAM 14863 / T) TaxID=292459 RepID=Q67NQ1_SYMTH|nr:aldo/keto reductase [Symbiobacterium thermophilum]BAD40692.1 oxidoreductase [Symbiobacterium thermophilum IAM 14863]